MAVIQDININVHGQPSEKRLQTFLRLSQNENGRMINFRVLGSPLPSGCTATFAGTKPDGNVYSTTGTVTGNFVVIQEDMQMTAVAGVWDAKLDIVNGVHNIMSALIRVTVERDVVDPDAIASDSELQGLVAECKGYAEAAKKESYGSTLTATTAAEMTDKTRVYVYTGSETGMTAGNWYYWNGSAWTSGGVYNAVAVQTDTTLRVAGKPADGKAAGDAIEELKVDLNAIQSEIGSSSVFDTWDYTGGYYIPTNTATLNLENPYTSSRNYPGRCAIVECEPGTEITITGKGGTNFRPISFCDASGNWLFRSDTELTNYVKVSPENTAYVVFNVGANSTPYSITIGSSNIAKIEKDIDDLQTEQEAEQTAIADIKTAIGTPVLVPWVKTEKYYVQTNVSSKNVSSPYVYSQSVVNKCTWMECVPGDIFTVSLLGTTTYQPFSFWTAEGARLGAGEANHQYHNDEIIAPANAAYVGFNSADGDLYGTVYKGKYKWELIDADNPFKGLSGVAFGTSLTYRAQSTGGYLNYLPTMLDMEIDNQGIGSSFWNTYTEDQYSVLWMVENYSGFADKDVCIIEGCVNDWGSGRNLGTYKDTGTDSTCGCLYNMFAHIYEVNPNIQIFVVLDHYGKGDHASAALNSNNLTQYDFYEECAKVCNFYGIPVIKLYEYSSMGQFGEQYFIDPIHPSELGARQTANVIARWMRNFGTKAHN